MKKFIIPIVLGFLSTSGNVYGQECVPPTGGKCLNQDQWEKVKEALSELDSIKKSEMTGEFQDSIKIISDWDGRVYVNGGDGKSGSPIRLNVRVGSINRTLALQLPVSVYYREKPPDPMFRIRIRAQGGLILPDLWKNTGDRTSFLDAGIGWDFFHLGPVNTYIHTGISSLGGGIGLDLTKNFGIFGGYTLVYRDFHSGVMLGTYFSFN